MQPLVESSRLISKRPKPVYARPLLLLIFVAVIAVGCIIFIASRVPTIEDSEAANFVYYRFVAEAKTIVGTNRLGEVLVRIRKGSTVLFVHGQLSDGEKDSLRLLSKEVEKNYSEQNPDSSRHTVHLKFE